MVAGSLKSDIDNLYHENQQILKNQDFPPTGEQLLSTPGCNILLFEVLVAFHLSKCTYFLKFWASNLVYKAFIVLREMVSY